MEWNTRWARFPLYHRRGFPHDDLLLFELCSVDGWSDLLYAGINGSGYDRQPSYANNMAVFW